MAAPPLIATPPRGIVAPNGAPADPRAELARKMAALQVQQHEVHMAHLTALCGAVCSSFGCQPEELVLVTQLNPHTMSAAHFFMRKSEYEGLTGRPLGPVADPNPAPPPPVPQDPPAPKA